MGDGRKFNEKHTYALIHNAVFGYLVSAPRLVNRILSLSRLDVRLALCFRKRQTPKCSGGVLSIAIGFWMAAFQELQHHLWRSFRRTVCDSHGTSILFYTCQRKLHELPRGPSHFFSQAKLNSYTRL